MFRARILFSLFLAFVLTKWDFHMVGCCIKSNLTLLDQRLGVENCVCSFQPKNWSSLLLSLHPNCISFASQLHLSLWCGVFSGRYRRYVDGSDHWRTRTTQQKKTKKQKVIAILIYLRNEKKHSIFSLLGNVGLCAPPHGCDVFCECSLWRFCRNVIVSKSISIRISSSGENVHFRFHCCCCWGCVIKKSKKSKSLSPANIDGVEVKLDKF